MINIVYEDNHVIVAVKPPNMLSQADKTKDADMLSQVKEYTEVEEKTVWQRIGSGFKQNLKELGQWLVDLFVWVVTYSPQLVLLAAILLLLRQILRRRQNRRKDKKQQKRKEEKTEEPKEKGEE